MRSTKQFSITLPEDLAELIKAKISTGEYASESDVISDGLHALMDRDQAIEHWLQNEVAQAYDSLKNDPGRAISIEQLRARIATERAGEQ